MSGIRFPPPSLSSDSAERKNPAGGAASMGSGGAATARVVQLRSPLVAGPDGVSARLFRLIADLQIPAVRVLDVEALEVLAHHVRPRIQSAAFELRFHFVRVPRLHAP